MSKKAKGNTALLIAAFIWGTAFVAQSMGMDHMGPLTFGCIRNFIGAAFLIPCIAFLDKINKKESKEIEDKKPADRKTFLIGALCCGATLFGGATLQQYGLLYTTVGKSGFLTSIYILIIPFAGILLGKKLNPKILIAVFFGLTGMYCLCIKEGLTINLGDLLTILCSFVFSAQVLCIDHFSRLVDPVRLSQAQFVVCGIISFFGMLIFEHPTFAGIAGGLGSLLYAGVMSSGIAYTLQVVGQKHTEPAIAALLMSLESVFSVLSGWVILGQALTMKEGIGCVLMFVGIIIAQI